MDVVSAFNPCKGVEVTETEGFEVIAVGEKEDLFMGAEFGTNENLAVAADVFEDEGEWTDGELAVIEDPTAFGKKMAQELFASGQISYSDTDVQIDIAFTRALVDYGVDEMGAHKRLIDELDAAFYEEIRKLIIDSKSAEVEAAAKLQPKKSGKNAKRNKRRKAAKKRAKEAKAKKQAAAQAIFETFSCATARMEGHLKAKAFNTLKTFMQEQRDVEELKKQKSVRLIQSYMRYWLEKKEHDSRYERCALIADFISCDKKFDCKVTGGLVMSDRRRLELSLRERVASLDLTREQQVALYSTCRAHFDSMKTFKTTDVSFREKRKILVDLIKEKHDLI